jgi:septin family protein
MLSDDFELRPSQTTPQARRYTIEEEFLDSEDTQFIVGTPPELAPINTSTPSPVPVSNPVPSSTPSSPGNSPTARAAVYERLGSSGHHSAAESNSVHAANSTGSGSRSAAVMSRPSHSISPADSPADSPTGSADNNGGSNDDEEAETELVGSEDGGAADNHLTIDNVIMELHGSVHEGHGDASDEEELITDSVLIGHEEVDSPNAQSLSVRSLAGSAAGLSSTGSNQAVAATGLEAAVDEPSTSQLVRASSDNSSGYLVSLVPQSEQGHAGPEDTDDESLPGLVEETPEDVPHTPREPFTGPPSQVSDEDVPTPPVTPQPLHQTESYQQDVKDVYASRHVHATGTEDRYLKFIMVGQKGLGKTTLMHNLVGSSVDSADNIPEGPTDMKLFETDPSKLSVETVVEEQTRCVHPGSCCTFTLKYHFTLQDTPGLVFGETQVPVLQYLQQQQKQYYLQESDPTKTEQLYAGKDPRVDACVYFISPHGITNTDVKYMSYLSELVPVIPVLAKADTMTSQELQKHRQEVLRRVREASKQLGRSIIWQPSEAVLANLRAQHEVPPFAVAGSRTMDERMPNVSWPVRVYEWGLFEALTSNHSDLPAFKRLLFEYSYTDLKKETQERYRKFRLAASKRGVDAAAGAVGSTGASGDAAAHGNRVERVRGFLRKSFNRMNRGRRGMWPWLVLGLFTSVVLAQQVHLHHQLGSAKRELQKEKEASTIKDQVISELAASLGCANRRYNTSSRGNGRLRTQVWRYQGI